MEVKLAFSLRPVFIVSLKFFPKKPSFPSQGPGFEVPRSVYGLIKLIRSRARFCLGLGVVVISKAGALSGPLGVRQALRTTLESSAIKECQLCTGLPSISLRLHTFFIAASLRMAGATGSRVSFAC